MITSIDYQSPLGKSDHRVLRFNFNCYTKIPQKDKTRRRYNRADYKEINRTINETNWNKLLESTNDINKTWNDFYTKLNEIEDLYIPKIMIKGNQKRHSFPLDRDTRELIKRKNALSRKAIKGDIQSQKEYKRTRNKLRNRTRFMRKSFEDRISKQANTNPKAIWKYIKSKSKTKVEIGDLYKDPNDSNSNKTDKDKEKADILADFFQSVFVKEPGGDVPTIPTYKVVHKMESLHITEETTNSKLEKLKIDKSPGIDEIHPRFLKETSTSINSSVAPDEINGRKLKDHQITVTKKSPSSISIAWDDFKSDDINGYVVEYKLDKDGKLKDKGWFSIEVGNAIAAIQYLTPNSKYRIRVSTFEDFNSKNIKSATPSIVVKTKDGCVNKNKTYSPEEKFDDGCKSRCKCVGDNKLTCGEICTGPFFRAGTSENDPYCFEKPAPEEPCCVIITCASQGEDFFSKIEPKQSITFATNEFSCPKDLIKIDLKDDEDCPTECSIDDGCQNKKGSCCENSCGGMSCFIEELEDPCHWTICGPHSECKVDGTPKCNCLPGFKGDPHDLTIGCTSESESRSASNKKCSFKEKNYEIGETFFDGCEFKCKCSLSIEVQCERRCHYEIDDAIRGDPQCTVNKDPEDSCCEIAVCANKSDVNSTSETSKHDAATTDPTKKPSKTGKLIPIFDGCIFKNKTFKMGETFYDGCSARCECGGFGATSCVPRCPLVHSPDAHCSLQPDPEDSCCKISLCNVPGEVKPHKIKDLKIILESVTAKNASTVRIMFTASNVSSITNKTIQIWYVTAADISLDKWEKENPVIHQMNDKKLNTFYAEILNLLPQTMYYFRVALFTEGKSSNSTAFSNTANIKTFPKYIGSVFNGCFRGNNTYEADEEFYDGCEYNCKCHAGGRIECQDRCTQYKDTTGYEHCAWQPSPDDNCCIIPVCDNSVSDPSLDQASPGFLPPQDNKQHETVSEEKIPDAPKGVCNYNNKEYPVKAEWEIGAGCLRGVCICIQNKDGTTKVDCVGGCPHITEHLIPTPECPYPKIVSSEKPCVCPVVSCNHLQPSIDKPMCLFKNRNYNVGEEFYDGCDGVCMCTTSLRVHCQPVRCPRRPATFSGCIEWDIPHDFVAKPPNCCPPPPVCKNDGACIHQGRKYRNFQKLPSSVAECGIECNCVNGNVTCVRKCALPPRLPPPSLGCPPNAAIIKPTQLDAGMCCMMWTCVRKPIIKQGFQDVKITPLNATGIRIRFIIPQTLIGHRGHAEIRYTNNPNLKIDEWSKKRFSRPQNIFDTTHIEYHLTHLRPNTLYLVQLVAVSHETKEITVSQVTHVKTLPFSPRNIVSPNSQLRNHPAFLPQAVAPSDRLPPPRKLPPVAVNLKMKIETIITSPTSVKVLWRSFDSNEKEVITGVKVVVTDENGVEETSSLIHQDVKFYEVNNLTPKSSYKINLKIVTHADEPIQFHSTNPVTITMPKDNFDMHVKLKPSKPSPNGFELKLDGIPKPMDKYVNIAQVLYQTEDDASAQSSFYKIKPESESITVKGLKPGNRYKVWAVMFLSNGNQLQLDPFEVETLPGLPESQVIETDELKAVKNDSSTVNSFYTAFVVVSIIAALIAIAFLCALYVLLKRKSSAMSPINSSQTAYNNPTYKSCQDGENYNEQNHENKLAA
ncbi:putative epidermal cell surface receptor [Nymphon striatum]|nr:putative epidermal cell surface receptor [Nymphon striatum]